MSDFQTLGLSEPLLRALTESGYDTPTPIQTQAIPALLAGRDLLGTAQTGTGKTAAFTLPLLDRLAGWPKPPAKGCTILVLAPTRELAAQIAESARRYGGALRPRVALVVGGVKPGPQVRALASGVDILVATPGRLEDHMRGGAVRLDAVRTVVLDEADQMLDLGFFPAIRRIVGKLGKGRQTALFSATMPPAIRKLASDFLSDPFEVSVAPVATPAERIAQTVIELPAAAKRDALAALLARPGTDRAIVFTRTKRGADKVARHLEGAGIGAVAIHGNKSQNQRERALAAFKGGRSPVLVATDIAARGIDVDGVSHVVNFELPNVAEAYVHRIGRTARAGKSGIAVSFCAPDERGLLKDIERLMKRPVPREPLPEGVDINAVREVEPEPPRGPRGPRGPRRETAEGQPARGRGGKGRRPEGDAPAKRREGPAKAGARPAQGGAERGGAPAKPGRRGRRGGETAVSGEEQMAGLSRMLGKIG